MKCVTCGNDWPKGQTQCPTCTVNRCGNCMYYDGDDSDTLYCNQLDGYTKGEMFDCDKFVEIQAEAVNHPKHYNQGKFEVIDVIEDWNLGFNLGNTVKYIARAEHKANTIEDLKKALWYLQREIERRTK